MFLSSCSEERLPEDYLAVVNDRMLTRSSLKYLIDSVYLNDFYLNQIVESWIELELLAQAALNEGFEARDEFAVRNDFNTRRLLAIDYLRDKLKTISYSVSKEELESYYQTHLSDFIFNYDIYKVNQAIVKNFSKAIDLRNTALAQLDFANTVRLTFKPEEIIDQKSGIFLKEFDNMPYELINILQTLEPGEISFPIDIGNGEYMITQLVARYSKNETPSLEFVKEMVEERIIFERQKKFYQELISKLVDEANIKIRE